MKMKVNRLLLASTLATCLILPGTASADWLFTPYIGWNFGGSATFGDFENFNDDFEQRVAYGASLGWMGAGIAGFEVDFGWAPNFFEDTGGSADFDFGDSNLTTLMANIILGAPVGGESGGFRPFGVGGIGLIRSQIDGGTTFFEDVKSNDLGVNVGAGIHGFFTDNVGLRGDVRYFRSLQDNEPDDEFDLGLADFSFWRASLGVTFRF